ncbi:hyaluronan mediated motility receptor [Latimeria chalumnae]|uniref:hyaluronan mediated motility receptor n=1 Tax=Latimeria chalumnae TaxID=7897 RepID=UPI00313B9C6C
MSFPRAPLRRFNDEVGCAPPPGSYDVKPTEGLRGPVSFEKSQRFKKQKGKENQQLVGNEKELSSSTQKSLSNSSVSSSSNQSEKDTVFLEENNKQKMLEKEIRRLVLEQGEQDKRMQAIEEQHRKKEAKLTAALREKTALSATVASLEKQLSDSKRVNELLKTKFSEESTKKKMNALCAELMEAKNQVYSKDKDLGIKMKTKEEKHEREKQLAVSNVEEQYKAAMAKQEQLEKDLQEAQTNLNQSVMEVAQLQDKLSVTEQEKCRLMEEKEQTVKKLTECTTELSQLTEKVEMYKKKSDLAKELLEQKERDLVTLKTDLKAKEVELSEQIKFLDEKCKVIEHEKEQVETEYREKESTLKAELDMLKHTINQQEQGETELQQKQEELTTALQQEKELSDSLRQQLIQFQEETLKERRLLEDELEGALDELDKLQQQEVTAQDLISQLEQENKLRAEELAQLQEELNGKHTELEKMNEMHSRAILQLKEEHSNSLRKLGEVTADFASYKVSKIEERQHLATENSLLQETVAKANENLQKMQRDLTEIQLSKEKAKEEYARMLLDTQTKLAQKDSEIRKAEKLSNLKLSKLQSRLEQQTEEFQKLLEAEKQRKEAVDENTVIKLRAEAQKWQSLYEELSNKVKPFQEQLDAFEAEKNCLLNENGAAQEELNKLSDAYAKLLGHQNQRQKIKHVVKLKEENSQLRQEVTKLRNQLAKEKQVQKKFEDQMKLAQGVRRFDTFKHDSKENDVPSTPLREGNRNMVIS